MRIELEVDSFADIERLARMIVLGCGTGIEAKDIETEAEKAAKEVIAKTEQKLSLKKQLIEAEAKDKEAEALVQKGYDMIEEKRKKQTRKDEKPAKKTREDKFDYGKLNTLLTGGWSVAKIADEFRVTETTIYSRIKKMQAMNRAKARS